MPRREWVAILALVAVTLGLPALVLAYRAGLFRPSDMRTIDIVAAAPENGGFQPDLIRVAAGEPVRLRFSVPDVVHGIAIGPGLSIDLGDVDPGQVREVETTFAAPGRYTIYCTTWCSPNHWRMRATIEVYDPTDPERLISDTAPDPVIDALIEQEIDIDAPRSSPDVPAERPSTARGQALAAGRPLPAASPDAAGRRSAAPADTYRWLRTSLPELGDQEAWDLVAFLWLGDIAPERLAAAGARYARNCAACHGERGDGNGPAAAALRAQGLGRRAHGPDHERDPNGVVAAFNDPTAMLAARTDVLYAKIRRGGMGTGMPAFGPVFTAEETWQLAEFLWTFVFDYDLPGVPVGTPMGAD
jgi:mono/diheme cytochrome c family protein/plastocyanin